MSSVIYIRMDISNMVRIPLRLLLEGMVCRLCSSYYKSAVTIPCEHSFCESCLLDRLTVLPQCPICNSGCVKEQIIRDYQLDIVIEKALSHVEGAESPSMSPITSRFVSFSGEFSNGMASYIRDLRERCDYAKSRADPSSHAQLEEQFDRALSCLVESYQSHMETVALPSCLSPIQIFIKVPSRNLVLHKYIPKTHTAKDIEIMIEEFYRDKDDAIQKINGKFYLRNAHSSLEITDSFEPIGKMNPAKGSSIVFDGDLVLKSEHTKTDCIETGKFFYCLECQANWICEHCSHACHASCPTKMWTTPGQDRNCECRSSGNCMLK